MARDSKLHFDRFRYHSDRRPEKAPRNADHIISQVHLQRTIWRIPYPIIHYFHLKQEVTAKPPLKSPVDRQAQNQPEDHHGSPENTFPIFLFPINSN